MPLNCFVNLAQLCQVGNTGVELLQCIGHYVQEQDEAAPGTVLSDYPLLLFHVQLSITRGVEDDGLDEAARLGLGLEKLLGFED